MGICSRKNILFVNQERQQGSLYNFQVVKLEPTRWVWLTRRQSVPPTVARLAQAPSLVRPIPAIPIAHWRHYCYEVHISKITKISLRQPHTYVDAPMLLDAAKTVYGTVCDALRMRPTPRIVPKPMRRILDSCDTCSS